MFLPKTPVSCLVEEIQWMKGRRESNAWPSLFVVYSCSTSWYLSVGLPGTLLFHAENRVLFVTDGNSLIYIVILNSAENLTLFCQTKVIRPHLHLISCWQRALLLNLIFIRAEVLCLWAWASLIFKNQKTAGRCYVKHSEAEPVMVSSFSLAFFSALAEHYRHMSLMYPDGLTVN